MEKPGLKYREVMGMKKFKGRSFILILLLGLILLALYLFFPDIADNVPADAIQI